MIRIARGRDRGRGRPDADARPVHRHHLGRADPGPPPRQRGRRLGERARGADRRSTLPIWSDGLHLNVTEPREHVLGPMVQHIGRRLTLKQTTNNTFIIGGGWPARPEPRPRRYSTRWDSMAGNVAVARAGRAAARRRAHRPHLVGRDGVHQRPAPDRRRVARGCPGYHALIATTGFTLSPLMARLLAETMATGRDLIPPEFAVDRGVAAHPTQPEEADRWTETTSTGTATGPRARPRSRPTARLDLETLRALVEWYVGQGMHGIFINGTSRRVVLAVAGGAPPRRRDGDRPGRGTHDGGDRLHVAHREGGGRARPPRDRCRRRRDRLDAAAVLEDVPRRDRPLLPGHLRRGRRRR